jgi:hypothetical protein
MSVSIIETLQCAEINVGNALRGRIPMLLPMAQEQLHNAITLLDKGYSLYDEVEPLLEKYGSVENVPGRTA